MRSIQRFVLAVVLIWTAAWVTWAAAAGGEEPLYKGKSLRAWLAALKDDYVHLAEAGEAVEVLGPKSEKAIPDLLELLKDDDGQVRSYAARALTRIGDKAVAPLLVALESKAPACARAQRQRGPWQHGPAGREVGFCAAEGAEG